MTQYSLTTEITIPITVYFTPHKAEKTIIYPVDFAYEGHPAYVDIDEFEMPGKTPEKMQEYILNQHGEELHEECMEWLRVNVDDIDDERFDYQNYE